MQRENNIFLFGKTLLQIVKFLYIFGDCKSTEEKSF